MRLATPLLAILVLTACGELPQPFRADTVSELARPRLVRAVAVRPVEGMDSGPALAEALVEAFGRRDVPALVRDDSPGAMHLRGRFDGSGGVIDWVLLGVDHRPMAGFRQTIPPSARRATSAKALAALADQAVDALIAAAAPLPDGPGAATSSPVPNTGPRRPLARIVPLAPLPGDGAAALERHLRAALERAGILVVASGGDYTVEGRVAVAPGHPGEQVLKVAWSVTRSDAAPLGTIDQEGAVPKGSLDGAWGGLARDIAEGGSVGIVKVIDAAYRAGTGHAEGASSLQKP